MKGAAMAERLQQSELNGRLIAALGASVIGHGDLEDYPLEIELDYDGPSPIRAYLRNATNPPGGRSTAEHKIQLIVPHQEKGMRGDFDFSDGRAVLVGGYASDLDAFILWDAYLHRGFAAFTNAQVQTATVEKALASGGLVTQERSVSLGTETVIAAHPERLTEAVEARFGAHLAGVASTPTHPPPPPSTGGKSYVKPSLEGAADGSTRVFEYDPDAIDRGTAAHMLAQDALAEAVSAAGVAPRSPRRDDPQFDLAWIREGRAFVAEVKSLTAANEAKQIRLGLGQVLSYAYLLEWEDVDDVTPVLAVERKPVAEHWLGLCSSLGVELTWPERFEDTADLG